MINNSIYSRFLHCSRFRNKIATNGNLLSTASGTSYHHFHHAYDQEAGTSTGNFSSSPRFLSFSTTSGTCNGSNNSISSSNSSNSRYPSNIKVTSKSFVATKQKFGTTTTSLVDPPSKHYENNDVNIKQVQQEQQQRQEEYAELRCVYVHPLSQLVLEYLQNYRHEWIVEKGLDRSLSINRDGSFELSANNNTISYHYPLNNTSTTVQSYVDDSNNLRIWTTYDEKEKKHWLTVRKGLSFRKQFLIHDNSASLLSPWNNSYGGGATTGGSGSSVSTVIANQGTGGTSTSAAINKNKTAHLRNERIRIAVNEMIQAVDQLDEKKTA